MFKTTEFEQTKIQKILEQARAELGQAQVKDEAVVLVVVVDEVRVQLLFRVGGRIYESNTKLNSV